jgi:hypothetical protein
LFNVVAGNFDEFVGKKFEPFESTGVEFIHDGSHLIIKVSLIQYRDYEELSTNQQRLLGIPQDMERVSIPAVVAFHEGARGDIVSEIPYELPPVGGRLFFSGAEMVAVSHVDGAALCRLKKRKSDE